MAQATMTSKGQITIPKVIRDRLQLTAGEKVDFIVTDNGTVILRPITRKVDDLFGRLRQYRKSTPVSVEQMNEAIRDRMKNEQ